MKVSIIKKKKIAETIMFTCILILTLFLPVTFLSLALGTLFSADELSEMGICLEGAQSMHDETIAVYPQGDDNAHSGGESGLSSESQVIEEAGRLWKIQRTFCSLNIRVGQQTGPSASS